MFGIGGNELIIILIFALLIFGPDKLPEIGRTVGRAMRQFQKAQDDMKRVISMEMYSKDEDKENSPFRPTKSILDPDYGKEDEEKVVGKKEEADKSSLADSLYGLSDEPAKEQDETPLDQADTASEKSDPAEADSDQDHETEGGEGR